MPRTKKRRTDGGEGLLLFNILYPKESGESNVTWALTVPVTVLPRTFSYSYEFYHTEFHTSWLKEDLYNNFINIDLQTIIITLAYEVGLGSNIEGRPEGWEPKTLEAALKSLPFKSTALTKNSMRLYTKFFCVNLYGTTCGDEED